MKRRVWPPEEMLRIVLEDLRGQGAFAEVHNRHQLGQAQECAWRDWLVGQGPMASHPWAASATPKLWQQVLWQEKAHMRDIAVEFRSSAW